MNDDKIKPLPCPFCSCGDVEIKQEDNFGAKYFVICMKCFARSSSWREAKHAIEAWNRRPIAQEVREEEKHEPARVHRYAEYFERMTKAESQLSALTKENEERKSVNDHLCEQVVILGNEVAQLQSKLSALTKERDTFKTYMVDVLGVKESNLNLVKALTQENKELKEAHKAALDSAEFSWSVICNVNGGDWEPQGEIWGNAAKLARETFYRALYKRPQSMKPKSDAAAQSMERNKEGKA